MGNPEKQDKIKKKKHKKNKEGDLVANTPLEIKETPIKKSKQKILTQSLISSTKEPETAVNPKKRSKTHKSSEKHKPSFEVPGGVENLVGSEEEVVRIKPAKKRKREAVDSVAAENGPGAHRSKKDSKSIVSHVQTPSGTSKGAKSKLGEADIEIPDLTSKTPKKKKKTKKAKDNLKQITLHESLLARGLVASGKKSKAKKEDIQTGDVKKIIHSPSKESSSPNKTFPGHPREEETAGSKTNSPKKRKKKEILEKLGNDSLRSVEPALITPKSILSEKRKKRNSSEGKKVNKPKKMDVVGKTGNAQKLFGSQTINISDNSSDSAELKIATNEEDTSELSSEYDSSDSDHITKSIKSFNKKGAKKTPVKKEDEPPPPKPKPKIYSSSDDEDSKEVSEDDEDDNDEELEDDVMEMEDVEEPAVKPDADDVFLDGWTKADVQELLSRMRREIPKDDFTKASTRLTQLNWENIKFRTHSAGQCLAKWRAIEKKLRSYRILEELLCDAEQWLEHPWTDFRKGGKNNKLHKHPEMPKKPLTTYMIFYMKKKDKIAKEFPGLSLTDLSKVVAERFNKLPPNKKAKYQEMHLAMKEEYNAKMAKFAEAHPTEMARVIGNRSKKRTINMPGWNGGEKPMQPVKLYINEKMKKHINDENRTELQAMYKEQWKTLSAKKKLPFIRFAHDHETKYLEDLKAYQALNPTVDVPKYKMVLTKEERTIIEKTQGKPDKPPSSAYLLFSKTMLKNPAVKALTPKERMQKVASLWKDVPESEKEEFKKQVQKLHADYKLEYGSYLASLSEDQRKEEEKSIKGKSKRKAKETEGPALSKRSKVASKKQPKLTLEEIIKNEPVKPPSDIFELFASDIKKQFPDKNYPTKEIKKSFDALLEEPRAELKERLDKLKQKYLADVQRYLKSLTPEEMKLYSAHQSRSKPSFGLKSEVKLSESEGSDEEDGSEEEDDEEEEEEVEEKTNGVAKGSEEKMKAATPKTAARHNDDSSEESDYDDNYQKDKVDQKSTSSLSSSESSSDEEGSSSSSSLSSSSEGEGDVDNDAAAF